MVQSLRSMISLYLTKAFRVLIRVKISVLRVSHAAGWCRAEPRRRFFGQSETTSPFLHLACFIFRTGQRSVMRSASVSPDINNTHEFRARSHCRKKIGTRYKKLDESREPHVFAKRTVVWSRYYNIRRTYNCSIPLMSKSRCPTPESLRLDCRTRNRFIMLFFLTSLSSSLLLTVATSRTDSGTLASRATLSP